MSDTTLLHNVTPEGLRLLIRELFAEERQELLQELQRTLGEDDLISTGAACRILGVSSKVLKALVDRGEFTVYYHLKDKRYSRGELLDYRNKYRAARKKEG